MNGETAGTHVVDLLPAYINGTLDERDFQRVDHHLARCSFCRNELEVWQTLGDVARTGFDFSTSALPTSAILNSVFARLDGEAEVTLAPRRQTVAIHSLTERCAGALRLIGSQVRLVHWGIWLAGTLATLFCLVPLIRPDFLAARAISLHIAIIQSYVAPIVVAFSLAFIYGPETDVGLEITLSTPVSPRRILLSRLPLVLVYNLVLALLVTLIAVALHGGNFTLLVSFWAGPMLLLSGLSLALSVGIGAILGFGAAGGLWLIHLFVTSIAVGTGPVLILLTPLAAMWRTTPVMLLLAGVFFALAVVYAPRCVPRVGIESA